MLETEDALDEGSRPKTIVGKNEDLNFAKAITKRRKGFV